MTVGEMVGWHHQLTGHELEQTLDVGDGQESLMCCSPWGHKKSDITEQLNLTEPFPSSGDLPDPEVKSGFPACRPSPCFAGGFFTV